MKPISQTQDDILYRKLQQHLDRQPVGFPPAADGSDIRLLKHVFTPEQARLATCLSHAPQSIAQIFKRAQGMVASRDALCEQLDEMVKNGGIEFRHEKGQDLYANTPLVVGIYELQVDRLSPEFIKDFKAYTSGKRFGISFLSTKRSQMRTVPINKSITPDLPAAAYDQVLNLLESADAPFVVLPCICRRKKEILGHPCTQTDRVETCMAMGGVAQTLIKMELGREIVREEAVEIIRQNQDDGLVLQPSNTQKIEFLCACCGCCCSMLGLQKDLPRPLDFWESGFTAVLGDAMCVGCGNCLSTCSTDALSRRTDTLEHSKQGMPPQIDPSRCIGCGQCVAACKFGALTLVPRSGQSPPPKDRETLNAILLEGKKDRMAPVKILGKLAGGILSKRDLRLLKSKP
ncbi:MAG: 4Fe-4S ferredoxin [Deltaproteobacteria bacterium]|nr:MAG: 4Fe-4S ferredoxin [Deltaproteobacteria bacterium]